MTDPELTPHQREVAHWQAELLRRIQHLEHEHSRISQQGYEGYDGTDPQLEWTMHLDALAAEREALERQALQAGVESAWIEDVRELGSRTAVAPQRAELPSASSEVQQFWFDMMAPDLWALERMAYLAAAYQDRVATGRVTFEISPTQARHFERNMRVHHKRATALAHMAQVSTAEGQQLWGINRAGWLRLHTSYIGAQTEDGLRTELRKYMSADPGLAVPPYVAVDADGEPIPRAESLPPAPEQMIAEAYTAIRTQFVEDALAPDVAMTAAIELALPPAVVGEWSSESSPTTGISPDPHKQAGPEP
ncbi:hypothetical protein [Nocardia nepalensis]|uniref:hypothetical protein n=1 Tax=Nocardia nepalensis TaxID=3375448 RepID=UPI003B67D5ED